MTFHNHNSSCMAPIPLVQARDRIASGVMAVPGDTLTSLSAADCAITCNNPISSVRLPMPLAQAFVWVVSSKQGTRYCG